jgi:hypothetical protein
VIGEGIGKVRGKEAERDSMFTADSTVIVVRVKHASIHPTSRDGTQPAQVSSPSNPNPLQHGVKRSRESLDAKRQRESAKLSAYLALTDDIISRACLFFLVYPRPF